jgi:hypothetical protein
VSRRATGFSATPPKTWTEDALFLRDPSRALGLDGGAFAHALTRFRTQALSALFVHRLRAAGVLSELDGELAGACAQEEAKAKASHAALMSGVERVLSTWEGKVARPYALKGLHVGAAYYPAPHLRSMADADLLFRDLPEGERAWALARDLGMVPQGVPLARDPWLGAHELPMLQDPVTRFTLEVQGSLLFSTRDRRWLALAKLLDDPVEVEVAGHRLFGLRPEANLVYILAHNFVQHAGAGPKLQPLLDVSLLLERESRSLDWSLPVKLAVEGGLAPSTALGLRWARDLLGAAVPEEVLSDFDARRRARAFSPALQSSSQERLSLEELLFQATWRDRARLLWARACPTPEYMRERYPEHVKRPLMLLYATRWWGQMTRGVRAVFER